MMKAPFTVLGLLMLTGCSSLSITGDEHDELRVITKNDLVKQNVINAQPGRSFTVNRNIVDEAFVETHSDVAVVGSSHRPVLTYRRLDNTPVAMPITIAELDSDKHATQQGTALSKQGDQKVWEKYCNGAALTPEEVAIVNTTQAPSAIKTRYMLDDCNGYK